MGVLIRHDRNVFTDELKYPGFIYVGLDEFINNYRSLLPCSSVDLKHRNTFERCCSNH